MENIPYLIIPILSGFIFSILVKPVRYQIARSDGQRLYFHAALWGTFLLIFSSGIYLLFIHDIVFEIKLFSKYFKKEDFIFYQLFKIEFDGLFILLLTLLLSILFPLLINHLINVAQVDAELLEKAVEQNEFDSLFLKSVNEKKLISVTLSNRKVYIGWVLEVTPSSAKVISPSYLRILGLFSGYRKEDNLELTIENNYSDPLKKMLDKAAGREYNKKTTYWSILRKIFSFEIRSKKYNDEYNRDDFQIIIPYSEIVYANIFDLSLYIEMKKNKSEINQKSKIE
jgi:hypothetical protein